MRYEPSISVGFSLSASAVVSFGRSPTTATSYSCRSPPLIHVGPVTGLLHKAGGADRERAQCRHDQETVHLR
ncbi:MAG: hypothetical protein AVDCRST_MAG01-01-4092 [uncultured Rubrobacteraceae bacterium]|uniref:Uncharacterized protein n=1 Tax=uncultured Rubrobacteraceae bacterium TaxID=349277 RepID=A0A6J4QTQ3_9ACTN|nr:MAG: hypothetical protein AVDCRST_MAG01-01-4092 [uncultured Rubrobacteraceae bacterium]